MDWPSFIFLFASYLIMSEHEERHIIHIFEEMLHELRLIEHHLRSHPHQSKSIEIKFGGTMPAIPISEAIGQSTTATAVPMEADGTTPTPGATLSGVTWTVDNPAIVTQTINADNTASYKAVAVGTATVTVSATVKDSDGTTASFTATNTITVTQPTGRTAGLQINFSTPV